MTEIKERGDRMEEACGVFGIYAQDEAINVAEAAYYGLFALQHRGQESAGIAVADGKGIKHYRNLGLVPEVFDEEILHGLTGHISIGHVRYSTFGGKDVINAQPLVARCKIGMLALAHNGNLVNADALRSQMEDDGAIFQTTVDTEVILSLIARESSKGLIEAVRSMMEKVRGSYALVLLAKDKLIGIRDPPPALPGARGQQLRAGERELRARRGGRGICPRCAAGRNRGHRRRRHSLDPRENADAQSPVPV